MTRWVCVSDVPGTMEYSSYVFVQVYQNGLNPSYLLYYSQTELAYLLVPIMSLIIFHCFEYFSQFQSYYFEVTSTCESSPFLVLSFLCLIGCIAWRSEMLSTSNCYINIKYLADNHYTIFWTDYFESTMIGCVAYYDVALIFIRRFLSKIWNLLPVIQGWLICLCLHFVMAVLYERWSNQNDFRVGLFN